MDKEILLVGLATEVICDMVTDNSVFIHYTCKNELPYLKQLLENGIQEPWVIKEGVERIERQFEMLWVEFKRYENFIYRRHLNKNI